MSREDESPSGPRSGERTGPARGPAGGEHRGVPWRLALVGLFVGSATIFGTRHVLSRLRSGPGTGPGEEHVVFLAHLLLPLSIALSLIVAIVVVAAALRLLAALLRKSDRSG